jgi:hypothetical protein
MPSFWWKEMDGTELVFGNTHTPGTSASFVLQTLIGSSQERLEYCCDDLLGLLRRAGMHRFSKDIRATANF